METKYTPSYFLSKFDSIPPDKWYETNFLNPKDRTCRCALGHCDVEQFEDIHANEEALALINIFEYNSMRQGPFAVIAINDTSREFTYLGRSPKQRIINRLKEIKNELESDTASKQD